MNEREGECLNLLPNLDSILEYLIVLKDFGKLVGLAKRTFAFITTPRIEDVRASKRTKSAIDSFLATCAQINANQLFKL